MTRIKICGITNYEDAIQAVRLGADALGFIFAPSPRQVAIDKVRIICKALPPFVNRVGVFTDQSRAEIEEAVRYCRLDTVQIHDANIFGRELNIPVPVIKAFQVKNRDILKIIENENPGYFLMDTHDPDKAGGTGKVFDWEIAREAAGFGRLILSGGLNHDNVIEALNLVHPYAVDVGSGVEKSPGLKDHHKMQRFINEVRTWDNQAG